MLALLTTLLLTAAPDPAPSLAIDAERLLHDGQRHLLTYEGHARLRGQGLAIDAERLVYDEAHEAITASGGVVARLTRGGLVAITADVLTLKLEDGEVTDVYVLDGKTVSKKDTTADALLAADTVEALARTGHVQAQLEGNHLHHEGAKWTTEHLTLVPCECDFDHPSWSIESGHAVIDTEAERVSVTMPVVRIKHVPVLWLPWLSLPLTSRQTGLLFPRPTYSALNGFGLEQPVFITLGRSADLTVSPGFYTGGSTPSLGIAGPKLGLEFRYAPSRRAFGRVTLGLLWDTKVVRDPFDGSQPTLLPSAVTSPTRGLRGEFAWAHVQDFDGGFGARVDLNAYSDGFYNRDITTDVIAATAGYLRSTASLFQRSDWHLVSLEVSLRQDLQFGFDWLGRAPYNAHASPFGPGMMQRWPALTVAAPLKQLAGPLFVDATAEVVRLAPLFSKTGDEGSSAAEGSTGGTGAYETPWACLNAQLFSTPGVPGPCAVAKTGQGDRVWQPGEREARDRVMVMPRVQVLGAPGDVVSLSASAAWRQSVWYGEASNRSWQRGALVLDARAETELSRDYSGWRHLIQPLVAVRAIPLVLRGGSDPSSLEPVPYDDVDAAIPRGGGGWVQSAVEVRQRLTHQGQEVLRFDLGQGLNLSTPTTPYLVLGESWGRLQATIWLIKLGTLLRADPVGGRLTRMTSYLGLDDGRGHGVQASYENALDDGTDRTRTPIDLLFGPTVPIGFTSRAQLLAGSAYWNFGPVGLRYDLQLNSVVPGTLQVLQQQASVSLTPACDCWRVDVFAREGAVLKVPDVGVSLTVSRFGSIGTR
jgi:LPS-assembly protein